MTLQIVIADTQLFDFIEELVSYLEGKISEAEAVRIRNASRAVIRRLLSRFPKEVRSLHVLFYLQESTITDHVSRWYSAELKLFCVFFEIILWYSFAFPTPFFVF